MARWYPDPPPVGQMTPYRFRALEERQMKINRNNINIGK